MIEKHFLSHRGKIVIEKKVNNSLLLELKTSVHQRISLKSDKTHHSLREKVFASTKSKENLGSEKIKNYL